MDRAITASDANRRFSEMLRDVQRGESFVVTLHGRPAARISPVTDQDRQGPAIEALLAFVADLPQRHLNIRRRDDLYT